MLPLDTHVYQTKRVVPGIQKEPSMVTMAVLDGTGAGQSDVRDTGGSDRDKG